MKFLSQKIIDLFPFAEKYIENKKIRTELLLRLGLTVNIGYASYNIITGIYYESIWFGAVAIYYIMLCSIKFFLLLRGFEPKRPRARALKDMRICGVLLILLNITISLLIYQMINENSAQRFNRSVIFTAAGYAIFRIAVALPDIRDRMHHFDPTIYAARSLSFSVALMSLFSLSTSLLDRFLHDINLKKGINLISGSVVAVLIMVVAVRTLLRAHKEIKKLKKAE